jgi:hypothetical protein
VSTSSSKDIVARFVDYARELGADPPKRVVGQMAAQVNALLKEGQRPEHVMAAAEMVAEKGLDPSSLPSCTFTAARDATRMAKPEVRQRLAEYIAANGWPTGARFVRGTHGGTYVFDALGHDRPPPGYGSPVIRRPTRAEILAALTGKALTDLTALSEEQE